MKVVQYTHPMIIVDFDHDKDYVYNASVVIYSEDINKMIHLYIEDIKQLDGIQYVGAWTSKYGYKIEGDSGGINDVSVYMVYVDSPLGQKIVEICPYITDMSRMVVNNDQYRLYNLLIEYDFEHTQLYPPTEK